MGRDIDLVGVRHCGHAQRLRHSVVLRIDDGDIDAMAVEIGLERAPAEDRLQRSDRGRGRLPDQAQRGGLVEIHLEPHQLERLELLGEPPEAFRLVVEIEVDDEAHLRPGAGAQRRELCDQRRDDLLRKIELRVALAARRSRGILAAALMVEYQNIGL
jgi:hypothetical protein